MACHDHCSQVAFKCLLNSEKSFNIAQNDFIQTAGQMLAIS